MDVNVVLTCVRLQTETGGHSQSMGTLPADREPGLLGPGAVPEHSKAPPGDPSGHGTTY